MWRWQRSELFKHLLLLTKRQRFFLQLCLIAMFGHLFLMIISTMLYRGYHEYERFVISSTSKSSLYVLSPLQKQVVEKNNVKNVSKKDSVSASKIIDQQTYEQALKQKKETVEKKDEVQLKIEHKKELIQPSSFQKTKKSNKEKPKLTVATSEEYDFVDKSLNKVVDEKKKEIVKPSEKKLDIDVDDVSFVGYEQLDSLAIQHRIQHVVQEYFKPPVGISKDVSCELTLHVSNAGKAQSVRVVRSSGIVVYDSSARAALYKIVFPKEVWNKAITIVLGQ